MRLAHAAPLLGVALFITHPAAAVPVFNPNNGHYYEFVEAYVSWTDAKAAAAGSTYATLQGYLATITSPEENAWVLANIVSPLGGGPATGVWIGGSQSPDGAEPHGGWGWSVCTGEAFSYTNWETSFEPSPDNAGGCEEFIEMHLGSGKWGDAGNGPVPGGLEQTRGYIVEYGGPVTVPCTTTACLDPCPNAAPCSGSIGSACSDNLDNDGDGCTDYPADQGCTSPSDNSEAEGGCAPACSDGADNDGDGCADYPADHGCTSSSDNSEAEGGCAPPACSDGADNDGDGCVDYPADHGCTSSSDNSEAEGGCAPACSDGADNDGDGCADYPCDLGCTSSADDSEVDGNCDSQPPCSTEPGWIPYQGTGWRYWQVAPGDTLGSIFMEPGFDDSSWLFGRGAFGNQAGCDLNSTVHTGWSSETELLLRHTFWVPSPGMIVTVRFAVDNDAVVYINGDEIANVTHEECPQLDDYSVGVPASVLVAGTNVIAIRATDRGSVSFIDVRVDGIGRLPAHSDWGVAALAGMLLITGSTALVLARRAGRTDAV